MTLRTKHTLAVVAVALVAVAGLGATAAWAHGGARAVPFRIFARLDLTDVQKDELRTILRDARPRLEPLAEQAAQARRAAFQAMMAPTFDETQVRAAAEAAAQAATTLAVERARVVAQARALLTPDQQGKLDDALQKLSQRWERRDRSARPGWRRHAGELPGSL